MTVFILEVFALSFTLNVEHAEGPKDVSTERSATPYNLRNRPSRKAGPSSGCALYVPVD